MTRRHAEIVGAGLAGLLLATRLAQRGWSVRLHERADDLRMFGAGIWLWENGLRSLENVGAFDAAVARAQNIRRWEICDEKGNTLYRRFTDQGDRLLLPPRADVYQALIDEAIAADVDIELESVGVSAEPSGVLELADGRRLRSDLVVAADGAYSRLRESLLLSRWIDFGDTAGIRLLIDRQPGQPHDVISEYWNADWRLLYNPCTDGQDYIFLSAPVDDERARKMPIDQRVWVDRFPLLESVIGAFGASGRWDRLVNVRCRTWTSGRAVIVGDAAHAMPPNLGQAANMAFTNSIALAAELDVTTDVPEALRRWEARARPLTDHVQHWSYVYGFVLGRWPRRLTSVRSQLLRAAQRSKRFDRALNRGMRAIPGPEETASCVTDPPRLATPAHPLSTGATP